MRANPHWRLLASITLALAVALALAAAGTAAAATPALEPEAGESPPGFTAARAAVVREFTPPTESSRPLAIVTGPDRNLWFTEFWGNRIGRSTIAGEITAAKSPRGAPVKLAKQIATGSAATAARATARAFSLGGIPTTRRAFRSWKRTLPPPSHLRSSRALNALLASAAQADDAGVPVTEIARFLRRSGARSVSGRRLVQWLHRSVRIAQKRRTHRLSFTPLFVAEMVKRRTPRLNLLRRPPDARHLRLTGIELRLLVAFLERTTRVAGGGRGGAGRATAEAGVAQEPGQPCSAFLRSLGATVPVLGPLPEDVLNILVGKFGEKWTKATWDFYFRRDFGRKLSPDETARLDKAFSALQALVRLDEVRDLHEFANVTVDHRGPTERHKPADGAFEPVRDQWGFVARVGPTDEQWRQYLENMGGEFEARYWEAFSDCANVLGIPTPSPAALLAPQMGGWDVRWTVSEDPPSPKAPLVSHMVVTAERGSGPFDNPPFPPPGSSAPTGALQWPLSLNAGGGSSDLRVNLLTEPSAAHASGRPERHGRVTVRAQVYTVANPPWRSLAQVAIENIGGLPSALIDVGADFLKTFAPPEGSDNVTVTWHESCRDFLQDLAGAEGCFVGKWEGQLAAAPGSIPVCQIDDGPVVGTIGPLRVEVRVKGDRAGGNRAAPQLVADLHNPGCRVPGNAPYQITRNVPVRIDGKVARVTARDYKISLTPTPAEHLRFASETEGASRVADLGLVSQWSATP
jgi:hypothetical protein